MKSQNDINENILKITKKIIEEFPELIKHLNEIPVNFSDTKSNEIHNKNLTDYYNTLVNLVENYDKYR